MASRKISSTSSAFFANRRMFFRSLYLTLNIGVRVLLTSLLYLIVPGAGIGFSIWLLSTAPFAGAIFCRQPCPHFFGDAVSFDAGNFCWYVCKNIFLPATTCWTPPQRYTRQSEIPSTQQNPFGTKSFCLNFPSLVGESLL